MMGGASFTAGMVGCFAGALVVWLLKAEASQY
jgi:hypothetical protein